jgi:hypothetical protein
MLLTPKTIHFYVSLRIRLRCWFFQPPRSCSQGKVDGRGEQVGSLDESVESEPTVEHLVNTYISCAPLDGAIVTEPGFNHETF